MRSAGVLSSPNCSHVTLDDLQLYESPKLLEMSLWPLYTYACTIPYTSPRLVYFLCFVISCCFSLETQKNAERIKKKSALQKLRCLSWCICDVGDVVRLPSRVPRWPHVAACRLHWATTCACHVLVSFSLAGNHHILIDRIPQCSSTSSKHSASSFFSHPAWPPTAPTPQSRASHASSFAQMSQPRKKADVRAHSWISMPNILNFSLGRRGVDDH